MAGNARVVLLIVGLLAGGIVGWLTRPAGVELQLGRVNIEVNVPGQASAGDGLTSRQAVHVALIAALGAVIGFGLGYAVDRRG